MAGHEGRFGCVRSTFINIHGPITLSCYHNRAMTTQDPAKPSTPIRKAFVMEVKPGKAEEYIRRHNPIWPELAATLEAHGASNYSIFYYASTRQLFGYVEIVDESRWAAIAQTEVCQRWWKYMADIMPFNEDQSPASADLLEVFHIN
jgi:L-rhamnose mutarotase